MNEERGRKISTGFGIEYYGDVQGLLEREDLDVCIITCENSLKTELAVRAANSGKHILCDKPLGMNPAESEQIIRACKNANVKLQVGYLSRYSSQALAAKKAIDNGRIGKVKCVIGENRVDVGLVKMLSPWLANREASGGGAILEHAVHAADLSLSFVGSRPVSVYAVCAPNLDPTFEGEDNFTLSVKFANGSIATIDGSFCRASSGNSGDIAMKVIGSKGTLSFSIESKTVMDFRGEEPRTQINVYPTDLGNSYEGFAGWNMINDLVNCIRTGSQPLTSGEDAKRVNQIVEAAYKSLSTKDVAYIR